MKNLIQKILQKIGYQVIKISYLDNTSKTKNEKVSKYINCEETVSDAEKSGLSVCDYVEIKWNQVGNTQMVIDKMEHLQCFTHLKSICEIGAGTGRYMEKILKKFSDIDNYVSYEIQSDWADWLEKKYGVIKRDADGVSLKFELDNTIDLTHSHGVFTYLPVFKCFRYFIEMIRVTKRGGYIVFDLFTEEIFDLLAIKKWIESKDEYPVLIPKKILIDFFEANNCIIIGSFENKYGHSSSIYYVIRKN